MTIGERIKNRREELGMTQDELARKCGYKSRSSINKIELSRDLPLKKISLMADALQTTPGNLMGWEEQHEVEYKVDGISIEKDEATKRAEYLYDLYKSAPPEVQVAVEAILKSAKQDSGSHNQLP